MWIYVWRITPTCHRSIYTVEPKPESHLLKEMKRCQQSIGQISRALETEKPMDNGDTSVVQTTHKSSGLSRFCLHRPVSSTSIFWRHTSLILLHKDCICIAPGFTWKAGAVRDLLWILKRSPPRTMQLDQSPAINEAVKEICQKIHVFEWYKSTYLIDCWNFAKNCHK